ncbi:MAG: helix-turn-helix domain-containing protein [Clostridia bacterium]|nr:helix-turn-helix domain-containing protein [Clostridia bacterium]
MEIFTDDLLDDSSSLFAVEEQTYDGEVNMLFFHHHNHYEMMYMTKNARTFHIGDHSYELNQNNVVLLPPYLAHKACGIGSSTKRRILINFKKEFLEGFLPDPALLSIFNMESHIVEFDSETREKVRAAFEEILRIYLYDNFYKEFHLKLALCKLILLLNKKGIGEKKIPIDDDIAKKFTSIAHFINNNCHSKITLDILAETFEIDKFQLSRLFKSYLGSSFVTYVNTVRITRARRMMLGGLNNVTEIATTNGFDSPTHFSRVFKNMTGKTPKQYMLELRAEGKGE